MFIRFAHWDADSLAGASRYYSQQVEDKDGNQTPRIALDKPPLLIIEELNKNLINQTPENKYIFLILQAPINDVRNTKKKLASLILNQLHSGMEHQDLEISGNKITIKIYSGQRGEKKVIGAVTYNTPQ